MPQRISQMQIETGATIMATLSHTGAEAINPYPVGAWNTANGMTLSITTTKPNQLVMVISRCQVYQGGFTGFRYTLDGTAVGTQGKLATTNLGNSTTATQTFFDFFTVTTPGVHTVVLQVNPDAVNMRIINAEGSGKMVAFTG